MSPRDKDIDIIDAEEVWRGHTRLDRVRLRHRLFAGGMGTEISREVVERGAAVGVLPYDPIRDEVELIQDGEDPEDVARREATEETGCVIGALHPVCGYYPSQGLLSEYIHLFCGLTDTEGAGGVFGLDHEGEDIEAFVVPWRQVLEDVDAGRHNDAKIMLAVRWLESRRESLRQEIARKG